MGYRRDQPYYADGRNNDDFVPITDLYEPETAPRTDNSYAQWLTNGEWDQNKFALYMFLRSQPLIGNYTQFLTDYYDDMSYMKNNQLDWDKVKRPWKLRSDDSGAMFIRSGINFVSSNIKRLYQ